MMTTDVPVVLVRFDMFLTPNLGFLTLHILLAKLAITGTIADKQLTICYD